MRKKENQKSDVGIWTCFVLFMVISLGAMLVSFIMVLTELYSLRWIVQYLTIAAGVWLIGGLLLIWKESRHGEEEI